MPQILKGSLSSELDKISANTPRRIRLSKRSEILMEIGFIGLGTMGLPMAHHLLKNGYELIVYNRTKEKMILKEEGAMIANSPKEVALKSEVVFTMLTADVAVEEVILGENGIIYGANQE